MFNISAASTLVRAERRSSRRTWPTSWTTSSSGSSSKAWSGWSRRRNNIIRQIRRGRSISSERMIRDEKNLPLTDLCVISCFASVLKLNKISATCTCFVIKPVGSQVTLSLLSGALPIITLLPGLKVAVLIKFTQNYQITSQWNASDPVKRVNILPWLMMS